MKIVLLFLVVINLLLIKNSIINLFKSKEQINKELIESIEKLEIQFNRKEIEELLVTGGLLVVIFYSIMYILASIYVKTFWFTLVSILLIINNWRELNQLIKWINNKNEIKLNKFSILIQILYIGYLIYYLFITW